MQLYDNLIDTVIFIAWSARYLDGTKFGQFNCCYENARRSSFCQQFYRDSDRVRPLNIIQLP